MEINNTNSEKFLLNKDQKIENAYLNSNLWKLSLKVILPSLLLTLLLGIYIFIDQMLIINLVPQDGHNYLKNYFDSVNKTDLYSQIEKFILDYRNPANHTFLPSDGKIKDIVSNDIKGFIVYTSNQVGVFTLIVLSFGYLISSGGAVLFSKYTATQEVDLRKKVISSTFYSSFIFGIIATVIMLVIQNYILASMMPSASTIKDDALNSFVNPNNITVAQLRDYFSTYYDAVVEQGSKYIYFINAGIIFSCFINLIVFYLRGENNNFVPTLVGVLCNVLNIILDVIFIVVIKIGIMGGGLATFLGQLVNFASLALYLWYLNRKNKTVILLNYLSNCRINFKIVFNSILLGSSTFLRELSLAVANIVYVPVFMNTVGSIDSAALNSFANLAASPIYNLFFFAIFGIIDGIRPIVSYNYSIKKYDRVKKAFYIGTVYSLIYSVIAITFVFSLVPNVNSILESLNAKTEYDKHNLLILLASMFMQFPFISLSISGLAIFQSANKKVMNIILSIMQGVITFYPILFTMSAIASSTNNTTVMVFTGFTNILVSSIIIFICTLVFLYKFIDKPFVIKSFKSSQKNSKVM